MRLSKKQKKIYYRIHFTSTSSIYSREESLSQSTVECVGYTEANNQIDWRVPLRQINIKLQIGVGLYPMPTKISSTAVVQFVVRIRGIVSLN